MVAHLITEHSKAHDAMYVRRCIELSKLEAPGTYSRMINTLDAPSFEHLLAEEFHYCSRWVFNQIISNLEVLSALTLALSILFIRRRRAKLARIVVG